MSSYCKICGMPLDENGICLKCETENNYVKKHKKGIHIVFVVALLCAVIICIACACNSGLSQSKERFANREESFSKALSDGEISKKEFKNLIINGTIRSDIGNDELIRLLCETQEKYNKPVPKNEISREDAKERINTIVEKNVDFDNWFSNNWNLFLFEENNRYIFMEYYYDYENERDVHFYYIFDKNNDCYYMIIDNGFGDGQQCFRYIKSDFSITDKEKTGKSEYSSAVVLKATREMLCGFEWYYPADDNAIHTIYNKDGKADVYALHINAERIYYDSSLKETSYDYYRSIMDNYSDSIEKTYNFDIGHFGI